MTSQLKQDEQGAVAIIVAIVLVVLIGMASFAVDMGIAYASKRELSVTSDAAALAGAAAAAEEMRRLYPAGTECTGLIATLITPAARAEAVSIYNQQLPGGSDGDPAVKVTCADENTIDVRVTSAASHDTVFATVLGADTMNPRAAATARVTGAAAYGGLRPYAVCIDDVDAAIGEGQPVVQSEYDYQNKAVACGALPPGNWGVVDFDEGSNDTGSTADWTRFGYDGPIVIPDPSMPGDPGANFNSTQIRSALDSIVGKTVLFPVADDWSDKSGGNNASFNAVGVVSAEICGWYISAGKNKKGDCWDQSMAAKAPSGTDLIIQWRYKAYATSFTGTAQGTGCDLSDPLCVAAVRLHR